MNWPAFENPWMLAGLAAIGLPVLIHFLTRARPRRIAFPPFKFLVEACAGQQAIHRLRTILLLSVRCLAVLALVMLLARPFLKPSGAGAGQGAGPASRRGIGWVVVDAGGAARGPAVYPGASRGGGGAESAALRERGGGHHRRGKPGVLAAGVVSEHTRPARRAGAGGADL